MSFVHATKKRSYADKFAIAVFLIFLALCIFFVRQVDLQPSVSEDFFFSENDPAVREIKWVSEAFPSTGDFLLVNVASPNIRSERYFNQIYKLTESIKAIEGVTGVQSISEGPKDFADALESEMWRRLLIPEAEDSTNLMIFIPKRYKQELIVQVEKLVQEYERMHFKTRISGPPYIVLQITRDLIKDFKTLNLISFGLFALGILIIFKSFFLWLGMVITCASAILICLIVQYFMGAGVGLLTANLTTMVVVMVGSHIIFLTSNQKTLLKNSVEKKDADTINAIKMTFVPSLWCMFTTLLGFTSLLFVQAEPLRELGRGGILGTLSAWISVYTLYIPFLYLFTKSHKWQNAPKIAEAETKTQKFKLPFTLWSCMATGLLVLVLVMSLKAPSLVTDPSLLAYFDKGGEIYKGLDFIDDTGGTNPLDLVVYDPDDMDLNDKEAYERLWKLQDRLEGHGSVGISVSLPVLMSEGKRHPLAWLVSFEKLIKIMSSPDLGRVARGFITDNRKHTKFLIRMHEKDHYKSRMEIIEELKKIIKESGFRLKVAGGLYYLMGRLSEMIRESLVSGVGLMLLCFFVISAFISRAVRITLAMVFCMALVPVFVLGAFSYSNTAMDVISSASLNVCLGMAGDSMIHFVMALRRRVPKGRIGYADWLPVLKEQGVPIFISALIVSVGFMVFSFSTFPPNQRFGMAVVLGTLFSLGGTLVLFIFAGAYTKKEAVKDMQIEQ